MTRNRLGETAFFKYVKLPTICTFIADICSPILLVIPRAFLTMQTATMLHTSGFASASRLTVNRATFQKSLVPACSRPRVSKAVRAEADNAGGSITNSGKTKKADSYEVSNQQHAPPAFAFAISIQRARSQVHLLVALWCSA